MKNLMLILILSFFVLGTCSDWFDEVEEPTPFPTINLMRGSAGYEGDGEILGLRGNEKYLVRHIKNDVVQEHNPRGKLEIRHLEDWYTVDTLGEVSRILSSATAGDLPLDINETLGLLDNSTTTGVNSNGKIFGLSNGETYSVYFYGKAVHGERVTRLNPPASSGPPIALKTFTCNAMLDLRGLAAGQKVMIADNLTNGAGSGGYQTYSQPLNNNNHMIVLVNTPLGFYEFERRVASTTERQLRIKGYDYDIIVECGDRDYPVSDPTFPYLVANHGSFTVEPIKEGDRYFIMTASHQWRGKIWIDWAQ